MKLKSAIFQDCTTSRYRLITPSRKMVSRVPYNSWSTESQFYRATGLPKTTTNRTYKFLFIKMVKYYPLIYSLRNIIIQWLNIYIIRYNNKQWIKIISCLEKKLFLANIVWSYIPWKTHTSWRYSSWRYSSCFATCPESPMPVWKSSVYESLLFMWPSHKTAVKTNKTTQTKHC